MNKTMFSRVKAALIVAMFVCSCAFFTSCNSNPEVDAELVEKLEGNWKSLYDGYTISSDKVVYDDGGWGFGWEAEIVEITDAYIYVKKADKDFYCVSYKDLSDKTCSFSNAYKADGKTSAETLKEAKKEFTVKNGYFAYYGEYSK